MSTCKDKTKKGKCTGSYDKLSMNGTGKKSNGPKRNSGTSRNVGTSRNKGASRNKGTTRNSK